MRPVLLKTRSPQHWRAALSTAMFAAALSGTACADDYLNPIGGGGGGQFNARCSSGEFLIGVELRKGDYVDAIRPLCASANGPHEASVGASGDWHGGTGGRITNITCARNDPFVNGALVSLEEQDRTIVSDIALTCGSAAGRQINAGGGLLSADEALARGLQYCATSEVAVGVHGRSGLYLDAIGLICAAGPQAAVSPPELKINRTSTSIAPEKAMTALASNASVQMTSRITGLHGSAASRAAVPVATPAAPASAPALTPEKINRGSIGREIPLVDDSIRIEVRYPIGYGYQYANAQGAFGNRGIYSCDAFSVNHIVSPQDPERHGLIGVTTGTPMRTGDGEYICDTVISNLPRNEPVIVRVAMSGHRTSAGDVWLGGSQPQPGWQQVRSIVNGEQQVILTADQPSAVLRFDMIYAASR